jgi:glycosyltransferase involved in cell wall biosynthesis
LNTLNVLLPVYNARHNLERSVVEILEVLAEISDDFELCVLDDGSTDDSAEVAAELANRYPQIRVIRHPLRLGLAEAIQTGLDNTQGDFVLFGDDAYRLDPDDLRTLWQMRDTGRRLAAHAHWLTSFDEPWIEKLRAWQPMRTGSREQRGFQIIRRAAFEHFRVEQAAETIARFDERDRTPGSPASSGPLRPNFLGRIKRFARLE